MRELLALLVCELATLLNLKTEYYIGIDIMGYPIVVNFRKNISKSSSVAIAELNQDAVKRFVVETKELGDVIVAETPREVAKKSVSKLTYLTNSRVPHYWKNIVLIKAQDVIITMLPPGRHVWEVVTNEETELLSISKEANRRGLFLDCSTIDTATCKTVGAPIKESGLGDFADAPVSVSPPANPSSEPILTCDRKDPT